MPELWETEYFEMLTAARGIYEEDLLPDLVQELYTDYLRALDDIIADVAAGEITPARAAALRESILLRLAELADRLGLSGDGAMVTAADLAASGHELGMEAAIQRTGISVSYSFAAVPQEALELMMQRRGLGLSTTFRTLINRNLQDLAPELDSLLTREAIRGVAAPRKAKEIANLLGARDPAVQELIRSGRVRIDPMTRRIISELVDEEDVKRAKSLLFDSYRVAVTETNAAYHEADVHAMRRSPVVRLTRWTLSGRHAGLPSSPDVCDIVAETDSQGFGRGVFADGTAPSHLHPFCGCSLEAILARPAQWDQPKPRAPAEIALTQERKAREVLQRAANQYSRNITDRHVWRQTMIANEYRRRAHQVAQEALIGA